MNGLQSMRKVRGFFIATEKKKYMDTSDALLSPSGGTIFFADSLAVFAFSARKLRENIDKPALNLDSKSRRFFINLLKKFEHTKIFVSHNLDLILDVCERYMVIKKGRIMADSPVREFLSDENSFKENNLELPLSLQNSYVQSR